MTNQSMARELALDCLIEIMEKDQYSHLVLKSVLDKYEYLEKQERAFLTRLVEGTLERCVEMDYILDSFSKVKVKKMKPLVRNLLRMSVYQLRYMDSVPDSAVCNEAVKLAKKRGFSQLSGFVNGVLRSIARQKNEITFGDRSKDMTAFLEVQYSMPRWIVEQFLREYGEAKTEEILRGFHAQRGLSVRVNLAQTTPGKLAEELASQGITVKQNEEVSYALELFGYDHLNAIPQFVRGDFYVQDVSSMLVAQTADPKENAYIIDVCAAPGGKSTHLAEKLKCTGMVDARDLTAYKVGLIEENRMRHNLSNLTAKVWDATVFDEASEERADVLICDLPCSGLGVLGKKTDIRYKMTPQKQAELVDLQRLILKTVHSYVKKGGTMIYSTCTIHRAENEENVAWFLAQYPEFRLVSKRQLLPGQVGQDGFFIAKLVRE